MTAVWLAAISGAGTHSDPFRPDADIDGPWSIIDLRPDPTRGDGFCVLAADDTDTALQLSDDPTDPMSDRVRRTVGNLLDVGLDTPTPSRMLRQLLIANARTDGTRWKPLRPTDGRYEIWLGNDLIDAMPVIRGGAGPFRETFLQADSSTLGPLISWTEVAGDLQTVANKCRAVATSTFSTARTAVDIGSDDNRACITVMTHVNPTGAADLNYAASMARYQSAAATAYALETGYAGSGHPSDLGEHTVHKYVAGTVTALSNVVVPPPFTPYLNTISCSGSTIRGSTAVLTVTVTDTSITTGQRGGMWIYATTAVADVEIGDFWHSLIPAPTPPRRAVLLIP